MKKFVVIVVVLFLGIKYGVAYFFSDAFQEYADRTKAPWTCRAENVTGQLHIVMSEYKKGLIAFTHTMKRCPESPMAEEVEYGRARCLEGMGYNRDAEYAYMKFAEKYPKSKRAKIAIRAADLLHMP